MSKLLYLQALQAALVEAGSSSCSCWNWQQRLGRMLMHTKDMVCYSCSETLYSSKRFLRPPWCIRPHYCTACTAQRPLAPQSAWVCRLTLRAAANLCQKKKQTQKYVFVVLQVAGGFFAFTLYKSVSSGDYGSPSSYSAPPPPPSVPIPGTTAYQRVQDPFSSTPAYSPPISHTSPAGGLPQSAPINRPQPQQPQQQQSPTPPQQQAPPPRPAAPQFDLV